MPGESLPQNSTFLCRRRFRNLVRAKQKGLNPESNYTITFVCFWKELPGGQGPPYAGVPVPPWFFTKLVWCLPFGLRPLFPEGSTWFCLWFGRSRQKSAEWNVRLRVSCSCACHARALTASLSLLVRGTKTFPLPLELKLHSLFIISDFKMTFLFIQAQYYFPYSNNK